MAGIRLISEALSNLFKKPATVSNRADCAAPAGFRGAPVLTDPSGCIGCSLCMRDCPSRAIEMVSGVPRKKPAFHLDRCTFCAQCAESCPKKVIKMSEAPVVASFSRDQMVSYPMSTDAGSPNHDSV